MKIDFQQPAGPWARFSAHQRAASCRSSRCGGAGTPERLSTRREPTGFRWQTRARWRPLPRRLSYRPPCRASDPQAWATYQRDHSIFSSLQTPFGSLAAAPADTCSHLNYGDDAVINRPNENDRAGNLVREEAMILELGQVTIKQARYRIKRR